MILTRRAALAALAGLAALPSALSAKQASPPVLRDWYRLILELVRHTATYSPPVAARAFAYVGVTAHEALAAGDPARLAGRAADRADRPARPRPAPAMTRRWCCMRR